MSFILLFSSFSFVIHYTKLIIFLCYSFYYFHYFLCCSFYCFHHLPLFLIQLFSLFSFVIHSVFLISFVIHSTICITFLCYSSCHFHYFPLFFISLLLFIRFVLLFILLLLPLIPLLRYPSACFHSLSSFGIPSTTSLHQLPLFSYRYFFFVTISFYLLFHPFFFSLCLFLFISFIISGCRVPA